MLGMLCWEFSDRGTGRRVPKDLKLTSGLHTKHAHTKRLNSALSFKKEKDFLLTLRAKYSKLATFSGCTSSKRPSIFLYSELV